MPNRAALFSSEYLTSEQMKAALLETPATLRKLFGSATFTCYYGYGTPLHGALHWVPMQVSTEVLPYFIEDSLEHGIVVPGETDLLITASDDQLKILFCHESDIHVDGSNPEAVQRFIDSELMAAIRFYSQAEVKARMEGE